MKRRFLPIRGLRRGLVLVVERGVVEHLHGVEAEVAGDDDGDGLELGGERVSPDVDQDGGGFVSAEIFQVVFGESRDLHVVVAVTIRASMSHRVSLPSLIGVRPRGVRLVAHDEVYVVDEHVGAAGVGGVVGVRHGDLHVVEGVE